MTNDIMQQRRTKIVKQNVYGRDSLDEDDVFQFRGSAQNNKNFSAFSAFAEPEPEETKVYVDERIKEDFPESASEKMNKTSVYF